MDESFQVSIHSQKPALPRSLAAGSNPQPVHMAVPPALDVGRKSLEKYCRSDPCFQTQNGILPPPPCASVSQLFPTCFRHPPFPIPQLPFPPATPSCCQQARASSKLWGQGTLWPREARREDKHWVQLLALWLCGLGFYLGMGHQGVH